MLQSRGLTRRAGKIATNDVVVIVISRVPNIFILNSMLLRVRSSGDSLSLKLMVLLSRIFS